MIISSGKFEGKNSEEVVLKNADYVAWYAHEYPESKLGKEIRRLVGIFNGKYFTDKCFCCHQQATRASVYRNNYDFMFWCDECNPYDFGAEPGKLMIVRTYQDALLNIDMTADGHREWKRRTIIELARGKGLPKRVTVQTAISFFQ